MLRRALTLTAYILQYERNSNTAMQWVERDAGCEEPDRWTLKVVIL